jgi:hypothetical protein
MSVQQNKGKVYLRRRKVCIGFSIAVGAKRDGVSEHQIRGLLPT